jgi:hypothetical protein
VRTRTILALFTAFAVLAALGGYIAVRSIGDNPLAVLSGRPCHVGVDADNRVELDVEQMKNAATISAVGIRRGVPIKAIVVALATAWQESRLENLSGGDRDSVGLFQQRPSQDWGTAEQVSDPRYAAGGFYTALLKVRGWQDMRVTEAAQAVQRSAHPEAYAQWEDRAGLVARALSGEVTDAVACSVSSQPAIRGNTATSALAESFKLDWGEVRPTVAPSTITVTVRNEKSGWQYAYWLVAHATDSGARRVRFRDHEWNASAGIWGRISGDPVPAGSNTVLVEVYS